MVQGYLGISNLESIPVYTSSRLVSRMIGIKTTLFSLQVSSGMAPCQGQFLPTLKLSPGYEPAQPAIVSMRMENNNKKVITKNKISEPHDINGSLFQILYLKQNFIDIPISLQYHTVQIE